MTRDGDGDYWRRENARRAQLDRAFWRDYEQRRSREREDREDEQRPRGQQTVDGGHAERDGDTMEAPPRRPRTDAGISYLQSGPVIGYRMSMPWTDPPSPLDPTLGERHVETSARRRRSWTGWWRPWTTLWRLRPPTSRPRGSTTTP